MSISIFSLKSRDAHFFSLYPNDKIVQVKGTVKSNPVISASKNFYRCALEVENCSTKYGFSTAGGKINLLIPKQFVEAHYPKKLYFKSNVPCIESGAVLSCKVSLIDDEQRLFKTEEIDFIRWDNRVSFFRALCRINFKRLLAMWGSAGGFLLALLSASKEYTEDVVSESFRLAGLSHILALSGMHVSIFSSTSEKVFKFTGKRITEILSLFSVILFVWFAGFSPSLTRALLGCLISFVLGLFCIKIKSLDTVCIAFLIQIVIFPSDFSSVSFMLSYLALLGITLISNPISRILSRFIGNYLGNSLASSISAISFTGFLSAKIFGFISPIGIISSIFISPLVTCFLILGLICIILSLIFPFLSVPLGTILQILYYMIKQISIIFAKVDPIFIN
ncbi:MAG: ComEC/Rec2 family competence protein [Treponemataceae bacterium]|nr:ComEC/Rec2 family competence protein [Treponemataceae bacterium]